MISDEEPGLPDFTPRKQSYVVDWNEAETQVREGRVTLQEVADKSLSVIMEELELPLPPSGDDDYLPARKQRMSAVDAGLRAVGKAEANMLQKQQGEDMTALLARIAEAQIKGRLLLAS